MIPYGHQSIDDDDIQAVTAVLRSEWLTQGPTVLEFEQALARYCGARYAVVTSSGTAALHAAFHAAGLGSSDEFITSPITFPATSNVGLWQGAKPIFVDIDQHTGNIDPSLIERKLSKRTKAIVPIDFAGRPARMQEIQDIARSYKLTVIEDACQALGASYRGRKIGSISDLTVFSFHPVKSITTGEGGAVLTNSEAYYRTLKRFITHGVEREKFVNESHGEWYFEMQELGLNYRLSEIHSALGVSQLKKLDTFLSARRAIAHRYHEAFKNSDLIDIPPADADDSQSSWHLYVIRFKLLANRRRGLFSRLRKAGIGVQVHHMPVYLHPYYQSLGYRQGLCPNAEAWYASALSLPIFPSLTKQEQDSVIAAVSKVIAEVIA